MNHHSTSRRQFLQTSALALAGSSVAMAANANRRGEKMSFGLVTYMWAHDWDLPTLIDNCEAANVLGVELRTTHAHGVEPSLNAAQRSDVQKRFADSEVTLVGLGSNERFDNPDPQVVKKAIETSKAFIRLAHDVGASGVKVKPDRFHPGVEREKTIEQIGMALRELGEYATGFGQQVRLETHGQCAELPTIKAIMDVADHPQAAVCWNCNAVDTQGKGLAYNFGLVKDQLADTLHVHNLFVENYPYAELIERLVSIDYAGWPMLEEGKRPKDPAAELAKQKMRFEQLRAAAMRS